MKPKPSRQELEQLRERIVERITQDPRKAASILTDWLNLPAPSLTPSSFPQKQSKKKAG